ncbi:hypothetical protein [Leptospira licerasiae]|uniref:hypothetical protein n=1 Tax=Leptospira licerasiae TaxID=447106 RepID=UPI0010834768|nr:hypothetical protein [Leptospira licerasiae]TGM85562.1 hypothetical protein EHR05_19415 [Leptospira licerasiae]
MKDLEYVSNQEITERQAIILNEIDFNFLRKSVAKLEHSPNIPDYLNLILHPNPAKIFYIGIEFSFAHQEYKIRIHREIAPESEIEKRYEIETIEDVPLEGINEVIFKFINSLHSPI